MNASEYYKTWDGFVRLAKAKHGNTYLYPKAKNEETSKWAFIKCREHGMFQQLRRSHVIRGSGCIRCGVDSMTQKRTLTSADYKKQLLDQGIAITPLQKYKDRSTPIQHKCVCSRTWLIAPKDLLSKSRKNKVCPSCVEEQGSGKGQARKLSYETIVSRLKEVHNNTIQLRGQYLGVSRVHRLRCLTCLHSWRTALTNVLNSSQSGCPACANKERRRKIGKSFQFKEFSVAGTTFKVQGYEKQGIEWILRNHPSIKPSDIEVETGGNVPTFRYKVGRRSRMYFPDIFLPKLNRVVEIKSTYTLGLTTGKHWKKNQAKAKAVLGAGYKFTLLVLDSKGFKLFTLPKEWYSMSRKEVLTHIAFHKADIVPKGVKQDYAKYGPSINKREDKRQVIAKTAVEAIRAIPKHKRKGQQGYVVKQVSKAIGRYV